MMKKNQPQLGKVGMAFTVGIMAGWLASVFLPSDVVDTAKKETEKKVRQLRRLMTDPDERERVLEIFNDETESALDSYHGIREAVVEHIAEIKGAFEDLDKDRYVEAVKESLAELRDEHELSRGQINKLQRYFEEDFTRVQKLFNDTKKDVAELSAKAGRGRKKEDA